MARRSQPSVCNIFLNVIFLLLNKENCKQSVFTKSKFVYFSEPGCLPLPPTSNSIQVKEHRDAWVVTFCLPGYKLIGSSAIYCDGYKWNDTAGFCVGNLFLPKFCTDITSFEKNHSVLFCTQLNNSQAIFQHGIYRKFWLV